MPSFIRSFSQLAGLPSALTRRMALALCAATTLSLGLVVTPAGAQVVEVGGAKFGVQRHIAPANVFEIEGLKPGTFANAGGDPVLHQSSIYAIFWDPDYRYLDPWTEVIDHFFQNMSTASGSLESVFAVDTQYTDKTNKPAFNRSAFRGSYPDKTPYPSSAGCKDPKPLEAPYAITCLSAKQVREQLESFILREKLPKGMETTYYVLTPPGVTICTDEGASASHCSSTSTLNSFCSYHAAITPTNPTTGDANTILYGVIPWVAGSAGDPLLGPNNQPPAYECQDGGFDPSSKPVAEEKETAKVNAKEEEGKRHEEEAKKRAAAEAEETKKQTTYEEAFTKGLISAEELKEKEEELAEEKTARIKNEKEEEEKAKAKEIVAREKKEKLEGPHIQEPNQTSCPNVYDGGCDIGLADVIITQIGSEQQDIVTNPLLNAWQDKNHNEVVDECRNLFGLVTGGSVTANEESFAGTLSNETFGSGNYYLNDAFNASAFRIYQPGGPCLHHVNLAPAFTAPTAVNHEEVVGFNGLESNIALNAAASFVGGVEKPTYATYTWNFGDGSPAVSGYAPGAPPCSEVPWLTPCAAGVFHSYKYGGTYEVTLTVRDVGGNEASVTHPITVNGPAEPSPSTGGGTPGSGGTPTVAPAAAGSSGSSSAPGSSGAGSTGKTFPGPVASQAAVTHSLSKALRSGLVISYSVNEQVAGQFQVLLASSVAKRIGLHGPPAIGLAPGSAPSIVIGKAILITTKGGRNTVKIQFGKKTAAKLHKLRRVSLTIRLVVRNASSQHPISTTVISTVNLSR